MKLIVTDTNWADEMDVWGFELILNNTIYEAQIKAINLAFQYVDSIELYVGSNEEIYVDKNFLRHFTIKDIEQEEVDQLVKIFGHYNQGNYLFERLVEYALDIVEEHERKTSIELASIIYSEEVQE